MEGRPLTERDAEILDACAEAFASRYGLHTDRRPIPSEPFESGFLAGVAYALRRPKRTPKADVSGGGV